MIKRFSDEERDFLEREADEITVPEVVKKNLSSVFAPVTEISSIHEALDVNQSTLEDVVLDDASLAIRHADEAVAVPDMSEAFVFDEEQCGECESIEFALAGAFLPWLLSSSS
ncbi:hypothetical protein Tco_0403470 [Tanacetum coccineum]